MFFRKIFGFNFTSISITIGLPDTTRVITISESSEWSYLLSIPLYIMGSRCRASDLPKNSVASYLSASFKFTIYAFSILEWKMVTLTLNALPSTIKKNKLCYCPNIQEETLKNFSSPISMLVFISSSIKAS